jgi:Protein of unknown function (DUF3108)
MIFIKRIIILLPFLFFYTDVSPKHSIEKYNYSFVSDKNLQVGEELSYVVKYAFFVLGRVTLKITGKKEINNKTFYTTIAYIDSYDNIPFVDIHQIYKSTITDKYYSDFFEGIVKTDEYDTFTDYYFKYDSSKIHVIKGKVSPRQIWTDSTLVIEPDKKYQDGLSIFYYARMNSGEKKSDVISGFVDEKKVTTKINFYNEVEDISIDAIDYPVSCVKVDGQLDFISIYGLTGYYEGWFTNDEAAIPVLAKMQVMVGNITLELKEWKRTGWKAPEYKD